MVVLAAVALTVDVGGLYLRRRELVNGRTPPRSRRPGRAPGRGRRPFDTPRWRQTRGPRNGEITADEVAGPDITSITRAARSGGT